MRTCPDCGKDEERHLEPGRGVTTNLEPQSGCCIECLIARSKVKTMPAEPSDFKQAQAGKDA